MIGASARRYPHATLAAALAANGSRLKALLRPFVGALALGTLLPACAQAPVSPMQPADGTAYRILVTNDDGIESAGIVALAEALKPLGQVYVVAPSENRSGASHSINIFPQLGGIRRVERDGATFGHGVPGTPADSVLVAFYWLHPETTFDVVVSGINYGTNVGNGALYSGTVGGAIEGALRGVPAIAFSQDAKLKHDFGRSAQIAAAITGEVLRNGLPAGTLLNVNIPAGELKGIRVAPMGGEYYILDRIETVGEAPDGSTGIKAKLKIGTEFPAGSDTEAYVSGYVSIAPLKTDWHSHQGLKTVKQWSLNLPAEAAAPAPK